MSDFFDSEIVKEELQEIRDLQNEIYGKFQLSICLVMMRR